jgi:hypothetical protein
MRVTLLSAARLLLDIAKEMARDFLFPPKKTPSIWCQESVRGGHSVGCEYLRYCRLKTPHVGRKHKDGDYEWGFGESTKPVAPPEEDIGQGEGCEGGKCEVKR